MCANFCKSSSILSPSKMQWHRGIIIIFTKRKMPGPGTSVLTPYKSRISKVCSGCNECLLRVNSCFSLLFSTCCLPFALLFISHTGLPQWRASRITGIIKGQQAVLEIRLMLMRPVCQARRQRREMAGDARLNVQFFLYLPSWIGSTPIKYSRYNSTWIDMIRFACGCGHKIGSGCFRRIH